MSFASLLLCCCGLLYGRLGADDEREVCVALAGTHLRVGMREQVAEESGYPHNSRAQATTASLMEQLPAAPERKEDPRNFLKSPGGSAARIIAAFGEWSSSS